MCYAEAASPRITETSICAAQQLFNSSCWAVSRFSSGGILPPQQAKCLPQIVWVRRCSHRFHRIHRNSCGGYSPTDFTDLHRLFGCLQGGALVSSAPTELRWCTSCYVGALVSSAPPEVSSICVNLCNLWEKILSQKFCEFSVFCGRPSPARSSVQICEICGRHFAAAEARIPPLLSSAA